MHVYEGLARIAYAKWAEGVNPLAWWEYPVPPWEKLPEKEREVWCNTVERVIAQLEEETGRPIYRH